jgi:SAM-dependent methyltransferase
VAETYDTTFTNSLVGLAQRQAVWEEIDRVFRPGQRVLEINCGTGVDALHLASRGVEVLACDAAPRMIDVARRRLPNLGARVEFRTLATEQILKLRETEPFEQFEGAFSNFAGLNCVEDLPAVARNLAQLLKPRAQAVLCLFGPLCAWEILWYTAHGKPRKSFRRVKANGGLSQLSEGSTVLVRYYSVRRLARIFAPEFRLKRWKGVGVAVPPSYVEPLAQRLRGVLDKLVIMDRWLSTLPVLRGLADHVLLTFERV